MTSFPLLIERNVVNYVTRREGEVKIYPIALEGTAGETSFGSFRHDKNHLFPEVLFGADFPVQRPLIWVVLPYLFVSKLLHPSTAQQCLFFGKNKTYTSLEGFPDDYVKHLPDFKIFSCLSLLQRHSWKKGTPITNQRLVLTKHLSLMITTCAALRPNRKTIEF